MCLLHSACPPPPPPTSKFYIDYCFQILLGGMCIPKRIWKQYLKQNRGATNRVHYEGFENSHWEGGAWAPVAPHYSPLRSHGIFLAANRRKLRSRKYLLRTCIRKTALWLKGYISFDFFILLFCKICFLYLTVTPSASRSLSKCRLHGFKMETLNSVHYLTNLRSSLLVTSRISCYEVACARLSESRDAAKIKQAKRK